MINWGDEIFDTALAFDFDGLQQANFSGVTLVPQTPVPLPGGYILMSAGLGLIGAMARKNNAAVKLIGES